MITEPMITVKLARGDWEPPIRALRQWAQQVPAQLQERARKVAAAAKRDGVSTRAAACVAVHPEPDGARVTIGGPAPRPHAGGWRPGAGKSTISKAARIAYRRMRRRPKRER